MPPRGWRSTISTVLGPILVLKLKRTPKGFGRPLVAEVWFYPDGSRILELSTKCEPDEAFEVAGEARAYLAARGVELDDAQETKTQDRARVLRGQQRATAASARPRGGSATRTGARTRR